MATPPGSSASTTALPEPESAAPPRAAFYCVSSGEYFLGAVAMINSLRLLGHAEPVHLLDCGLSPAQRQALAGEATVAAAPPGRDPFELKTVLPLQRPATTAVLIDTDMIATRPLTPLIEAAATGRVVGFANPSDRFVEAWGAVLGLGSLRRLRYMCSGLVALGGDLGAEVLAALDRLQRQVDFERSCFHRHDDAYELLYADQDVLNAILASSTCAGRVDVLDARLAPMVPFTGLELIDRASLRCAFADGTEPYVVHHSLAPKPWQRPAYDGVYSQLLRRLLTGEDVAIRLPPEWLPGELRTGFAAGARRLRVKARQQLAWRLGEPPPR